MRDDIWAEQDDQDPQRRPRSVLTVLLLAAIPWVIVAAIVFLPEREPDGDEEPPSPAAGEVPRTDDDGDADRAVSPEGEDVAPPGQSDETPQPGDGPGSPDDGSGSPETEAGPDSASSPEDDTSLAEAGPTGLDAVPITHGDLQSERALIATATVIARAWATGVDPHLPTIGVDPAEQPRYAEHVTVEAVHRDGEGLAVVVLLAVILEQLDDGTGAELRRIAVPLVEGSGQPALAGVPWWLSPPGIDPAEVVTTPEDDASYLQAAADALRDAGYRDIEVLQLGRSEGWAWIVEVAATAPGGEPVSGSLWLEEAAHGFELAGDDLPGGGR